MSRIPGLSSDDIISWQMSAEHTNPMFSGLRDYLADQNLNINELTGRPDDRIRFAPIVGAFILNSVRNDENAHVNKRTLLRKIGLIAGIRELSREEYAPIRGRSREVISVLLPYVPEMQATDRLIAALEFKDSVIIAQDVQIALGSLRHPIARRHMAIATGQNPPELRRASA